MEQEDLIGEKRLPKQLTKLLVEKVLEAEMADYLGYGKNEPVENPASNTRNGKSRGDAQREVRRAADRNFSRPPRHLRATVDSQAPDP